MNRILLIRTDRIGDLLMTFPAISAVRAQYPFATIELIALKSVVALIEDHPDLSNVHPYDPAAGPEWLQIARWSKKLRAGNYDAAVVFNPTRLFHAALFLAGVPVRIGYSRKWGFLLNQTLADTKALRNRHESEYNQELARLLDSQTGIAALSLPVSTEKESQARQLLKQTGLCSGKPIAVHPWSSNPIKSWPIDFFIQTAAALAQKQLSVILIGEPSGADTSFRSKLKILDNRVKDLTGQVPLKLLPALLKQCAGLISNDSGPAHIAAAVGTPLIVVAPESHETTLRRWAPLANNQQILYSPTPEIVVHQALLQFSIGS